MRAPTKGRRTGGPSELLASRELLWNMVKRDLSVKHRGSFLGMLWSLVTPALQVALYSFIFGVIARAAPIPNVAYPFAVHFSCGLVLWNFFSNAVGGSVPSIVNSSYLLRKVWFPRVILPLSNVLSALVTMGFEFSVFILLMLALRIPFHLTMLAAPLYLVICLFFAYGLSLFLSALNVFVRDTAHFFGIAIQLWFWGSPIVWSLDNFTDRPKLMQFLFANPMTSMITGFRKALLDGQIMRWDWTAYAVLWALAAMLLGSIFFARTQRLFPEMV